MHSQAYAAGLRDGAVHRPSTSVQHSYAFQLAQRDKHERASKAYAYHAGMAVALKARMGVTGPVSSHQSFTRPALTQSTVTSDKWAVKRYAPDCTYEVNIRAHNKLIVDGPRPEPELVEYSEDRVRLADGRSEYIITTLKSKGEGVKTAEARRQAILKEASDLAECRRLDARGRLVSATSLRIGSRLGASSPSNK